MADKVLGFKISEELHDKVKTMIEHDAAGSNKDWLEKAVALVEMQSIKQGATEYSQDLTELQILTTRIYELISNMIQRSVYIKDHAIKEISDKLEQRESIIGEYQAKAKTALEELKQTQESLKASEQEKFELSKQLENQQSTFENNQALIQEYKDKIDTLSTLVNQYKDYAAENAELKESYATEKVAMNGEFQQKESRLLSSIEELKTTVRDQQEQIERLATKMESNTKENEREIESLKVNHVNELTQLINTKDLEKDRAALEIERKYQEKLQEIHEQYNEKLARIYEKFETNTTNTNSKSPNNTPNRQNNKNKRP